MAFCPHCNMVLSRSEAAEGHCGVCGKRWSPEAASVAHTVPQRAGPAESAFSPVSRDRSAFLHPPGRRAVAWGLSGLFVVSIFLPHGAVGSCWLALVKGNSVCAYGACTARADVPVVYTGGATVSYCKQHAKAAPERISRKALQFPIALVVCAALFLAYYARAFYDVVAARASRPSAKPIDPQKDFRYFLLLSLAGIVGVNGGLWVAARYLLY